MTDLDQAPHAGTNGADQRTERPAAYLAHRRHTGNHARCSRARYLPKPAILIAIAAYDDFDEDSDPFGEHDFGLVEIAGQEVLFKIDYYDNDLRFHSPDPADPAVTRRIMTIFLPEEY